MRRTRKHILPLIERTVPMLITIGAVLSVLSLLFPDISGMMIAAVTVWGLVSVSSAVFFIFSLFQKKKELENGRMEQERDRFLSDVAHELKTPLTVIRGSAEAMSDGAIPAEQYPEYCARILRETDAMSRLVSDLLDVSRLRAGRIRFEPRDVDLSVLARSVCESMAQVAKKTDVSLICDIRAELPVLLLDYDRIRQLMVIFLDNAVKHTPSGGRVTLFADREGESVIIGVRDTGSGIAPEDLPYVFERFYKASPARGGLSAGTGIGLSVAQQIVRLHGGTVKVESEPGRGTCFTARIPLRECKENT